MERSETTHTSKLVAVLRVTVGHCLEMFDFILFGFYASYIGKAFFPSGSEFATLMLTFATFGVGFLCRPIGAVLLGGYIDRNGRRKGLLVTLTLMAIATLLIACTPDYSVIGWVAPALVVVGRLLQGFSAGAELGGVAVYLAEIAPPGHKGFYVAWQAVSQQVGVMAAAILGYVINVTLGQQVIAAWGWRIPFFVGCLMIPFLFLIRRSLQETPEFAARKHRPTTHQIFDSIRNNFGIVIGGVLLVSTTTVAFYLLTVYTPTFGHSVLKLSRTDSLLAALCIAAWNSFWLPVMGAVSDKIGRRPLLITFPSLMLLTAYPTMLWLVQKPSFGRMIVAMLWLAFLYSGYNGAMYIALAEVMPVDVRTTGFSMAFAVGTAVFGGFTPAIATWLVAVLNNRAAPGIWMSFGGLSGLVACFVLYSYYRARGFSISPRAGNQAAKAEGA